MHLFFTFSHMTNYWIWTYRCIRTILPFTSIPLFTINQCFFNEMFNIFHSIGRYCWYIKRIECIGWWLVPFLKVRIFFKSRKKVYRKLLTIIRIEWRNAFLVHVTMIVNFMVMIMTFSRWWWTLMVVHTSPSWWTMILVRSHWIRNLLLWKLSISLLDPNVLERSN